MAPRGSLRQKPALSLLTAPSTTTVDLLQPKFGSPRAGHWHELEHICKRRGGSDAHRATEPSLILLNLVAKPITMASDTIPG